MNSAKHNNRKIAICCCRSEKDKSTNNQIETYKRKIELIFENVDLENDILIYEEESYTGYNISCPVFFKILKDIRDKKII